ncbi:MAG: PA2928 family protein, partial [Gemmatimonadaceae bacterium]
GVVIAIAAVLAFRQTTRTFSALEMHGGPIVTTASVNGEIIALTSHWESRRFISSSDVTTTIITTLHWDLWSFSTADLSRKWVTRLASLRKGERRLDSGILGVNNGVVWLLADQLLAVSAGDGHVIGDVAAIEAKNPFLRGAMPASRDQLIFDRGLIVVAADGRRWRINDTTLAATLFTIGSTDAPAQNSITYKPLPLSTQFESYKARGYVVDDRWYGLMDPSEVQKLKREMIEQDFRDALRYTFWSAPMRDSVDRFGQAFRRPTDFAPIKGSPEFLLGGLLASRDSIYQQHVIGIANPTRFIVAHQDRLDARAQQQLTCIDLEGRVCWDAILGASRVTGFTTLAAGNAENWALLMIGEQPVPAERMEAAGETDPNRDNDVVFVRIKIADGSVKRMSFGDVDLEKVSDEVKPWRFVK